MMRRALLVLSLVALVALAFGLIACRPRTVEVYQKDGLRFSHHSDWKIEKDNPLAGAPGTRMITVEGPDSTLLLLLLFPASSTVDLAHFAENVASKRVDAIEKKLSVGSIKDGQATSGTSQEVRVRIAGQETKGIRQDFTLKLLGHPVPHQAFFYLVRGGNSKVVIMTQAATENLNAAQPSWQLIFDTLAFNAAP
jgi:hypothetical protein